MPDATPNLELELKKIIDGEVVRDATHIKQYSTDASLFVVKPKVIVWPKSAHDIE